MAGWAIFFHQKHVFVKHPSVYCTGVLCCASAPTSATSIVNMVLAPQGNVELILLDSVVRSF